MPDRPDLAHLIAQLRDTLFFKGLDDRALTDLAREAVWREHAAGEVAFLEGEAALGLYYLQFGWLKAAKSSPEGREQVLRFIGPGETFNEIGAFAGHPNPACPYCSCAVLLAHKLAMASDLVTADTVEATELPHLANKYHVYGVPRTVINEVIHLEGAVPEGALVPRLMTVLDKEAMDRLRAEWQAHAHAH